MEVVMTLLGIQHLVEKRLELLEGSYGFVKVFPDDIVFFVACLDFNL